MKAHVPLFLRHYGSDKFRHLKIRGGTRAPVVFFFFFLVIETQDFGPEANVSDRAGGGSVP